MASRAQLTTCRLIRRRLRLPRTRRPVPLGRRRRSRPRSPVRRRRSHRRIHRRQPRSQRRRRRRNPHQTRHLSQRLNPHLTLRPSLRRRLNAPHHRWSSAPVEGPACIAAIQRDPSRPRPPLAANNLGGSLARHSEPVACTKPSETTSLFAAESPASTTREESCAPSSTSLLNPVVSVTQPALSAET